MRPRIEWRHQYDLTTELLEDAATQILCLEPTMTIQDAAQDADINVLMKRMGVKDGSVLPATDGIVDPREYGDFTNVPDLREVLEQQRHLAEVFGTLPADIRFRHLNDPYRFAEWLAKEENRDEAIKLKLLVAPPEPTPEPIMKVEVVNTTPPAP